MAMPETAAAPAAPAYDLLIVGGGINGTGVARDAAGRGLKVPLVEKSDLASHTSSASTKLIHGGLRYLEYGKFRLMREALIERERLLRLGPHLIWRPISFCRRSIRRVRPLSCGSACSCTTTSAAAGSFPPRAASPRCHSAIEVTEVRQRPAGIIPE